MNMNMLFSMAEIDKSSPLEFADALPYGGIIVLVGMLTIFSVLVIIMLSLYAFKFFFHDLPNKKKAAPIKEVAPEPVVVAPVSNDAEIVAAISAAIAAAESESGGIKFRVVSFKRR